MSNELNKKLAEWAGLHPREIHREGGTTVSRIDLPNFTDSLDACFKWLVPKVYELGYWMQWFLDSKGCDVRIHHLNTQDNYSIYQDEDPALALCKAIEKLIDSEASSASGR